jgi:carbon-monoxide dehydrogenase large subunit
LKVLFTNKNVTCQYRAVGHPIAVALTEGIVDEGARALGMDPAAFRRRNLIGDDQYPYTFPSGLKFEKLSHHQCLDKLLKMMDYDGLRAEQKALREKGIYRGIGFAALIELTNPSAAFYGVGGARIASQDGCTMRLDPSGAISVSVSVGEQGQGKKKCDAGKQTIFHKSGNFCGVKVPFNLHESMTCIIAAILSWYRLNF